MESRSLENILQQFQQLVKERQQARGAMSLSGQELSRKKNQELLQQVLNYRPDTIVKDLADLQLSFAASLRELSQKLSQELTKLSQLEQAIALEQQLLRELEHTYTAAQALDILQQTQKGQRESREKEMKEQQQNLENTIQAQRAAWILEQQSFEQYQTEARQNLEKQRAQEEADYAYEQQLRQQQEQDQFENERQRSERELAEQNAEKQKDWAAREAFLQANADRLRSYKQSVESFEQELATAIEQTRQDAYQQARQDAETQAELLQKEVEGQRRVLEYRIQSLDESVQPQQAALDKQRQELRDALAQVQNLSQITLEKIRNQN